MYLRKTTKLFSLVFVSACLVIGAIALYYKPIYAVTLNGEFIGYTENKSELQEKINKYIDAKEKENVAFIEVNNMPEYKICLSKKDTMANDDEIYSKVTKDGTAYYKYYAITDDEEEKLYVASLEQAEEVVSQLKEKESDNIDDIGIVEKFEKSLKEFTDVEECIDELYVEPEPVYVAPAVTYAGNGAYAYGISGGYANIGVSLINPVSGIITSRYGPRSFGNHGGLDIGADYGTPIYAAAGGTVTSSGWLDDYGYLVVISHGNGVQTAYAHCSQLLVSSGQQVGQGQLIARVGSTGNSTGNHLHFEVRKDGIRYDPQNYTY